MSKATKQKQIKERNLSLLEQFNKHVNDEELKRNYDSFIKTKSIIEVRVERHITQIASLQDNINKHRNCIIDTLKLGYTDISYLISGLAQLETELERVNQDLYKSKVELDKLNNNIERYEELSERTKLTYFKLLSNSGDIKKTWLEFKEEFKDKIF